MREELRELWRYRELLLILVQRDLKVRYKNSVLGFGWSLINPLIQVAVITVVLKILMRTDVKNYHAYVFCATLPWLFFSTALMDSSLSLVVYYNLLRRTYFPRELIPLASILANLIHFLLATVVFVAYMALLSIGIWVKDGTWDWPIQGTILLLPIPILGLTLLVTGLSLLAAVWTLYFEDIRFLMESGLKIVYWLVPVLYFPEMLLVSIRPASRAHLLYHIYMLNPLSSLITAFRKLMLPPAQMPGQFGPTSGMEGREWTFLAIAMVVSVMVALVGYRYFLSRKGSLAERG